MKAEQNASYYNRLLLNIYYGDNEEYENLEDFFAGLGDSRGFVAHDLVIPVGNLRDRVSRDNASGVSIMLAGGGPTAWVDTASGHVFASGDDNIVVGQPLFSEVKDEINAIFGIDY